MSVTAYLHLGDAGENVHTCMNRNLGQSMYRGGMIFFQDSPLSCLTYFSMLRGLDGDRDGKDDREMIRINSGKKGAKTWESGGLSAPQTTAVNGAGWNIWKKCHHESISWTSHSPMRCFQEHQADWQVTPLQCAWPMTHVWNQKTTYCLSYLQTHELIHILPGEWKQTRSWLSVPRPPREERGGERAAAWVCVMSPSLNPAPMGPLVTHGILCWRWEASKAQWGSDLQVEVKSSEVYRNKHVVRLGAWGGWFVWVRMKIETVTLVSLCSLWGGVTCGVWAGWLFTSGFFFLFQRRRWVAACEGVSGVNNTFIAIKIE